MNYQEFLSHIMTTMQDHFKDPASVRLQTVTKNNGTVLDALLILNPDINISPTIFLNPYYHRYLSGVCMDDIYADIIETYESHRPEENIDITFFTDFDKAKGRIVYRLVNYSRNEELLKDIPHYRFLDFAIIFHCLLSSGEDDYATILIHNSHMDYWGIPKHTLYALAKANTPFLLPYQLCSMLDLVADMLPSDADYSTLQPMYILSNKGRVNGASCILYDGLLAAIAKQLGSDFIVIPSSIHEVILIPVANCSEITSYSAMVTEVNDTQLSDDEVLSDHAYYYERAKGVLAM